MSATRALARNVSRLTFQDLSPRAVEAGKLAVLDAVGNAIGGYPLSLSPIFLNIAKNMGGGREEATLIGDGTRVSSPLAAFGNTALTSMLDYSDRASTSLAVCAALAVGEPRRISGKELIVSVVAGSEAEARISRSMDMSDEQARRLGRTKPVQWENITVFEAAGAAGRALGLDEDQMLSAIGMTGIYCPVPAGYKWLGDEGLIPRKDIKQGWGWMGMTGTFAAVTAQSGLKMLQENNILDGDKGLWLLLGMDVFREEKLTADFGPPYYIEDFSTKAYPGCTVTHTAMVGARALVKEGNVALDDIERIDVITNADFGVGFHEKEPDRLCDQEFSMPYQVSAALFAGDKGPNWYSDRVARSPEIADMKQRVTLSFDQEAHDARHLWMSKVVIHTKSGRHYSKRVDGPTNTLSDNEVREKFITTASQVIDQGQADKLRNTIENLEKVEDISELVGLLHAPTPRGA